MNSGNTILNENLFKKPGYILFRKYLPSSSACKEENIINTTEKRIINKNFTFALNSSSSTIKLKLARNIFLCY